MLVLFSAITIVLACANLSGLLLARWSTREVDLAVQAALGASNARLVSQVIGESLALSMVAVMLSAPLATRLASALRADPGIEAAALTWNEPLSFGADWRRRPIAGRDGLGSARSFVLQVMRS